MLTMQNDNETIRLALLELASNFAADKTDVRYYLQDVYCKNVDKDCHIVAANGHMLIKITISNYQTVMPERISVPSIKKACKVREASLLTASATNPAVAYPDYERLLANNGTPAGMPLMNANYLAIMASAIKKAWGIIMENKIPDLEFIAMSDISGSLFKTAFKFPKEDTGIIAEMVIMPMRKNK